MSSLTKEQYQRISQTTHGKGFLNRIQTITSKAARAFIQQEFLDKELDRYSSGMFDWRDVRSKALEKSAGLAPDAVNEIVSWARSAALDHGVQLKIFYELGRGADHQDLARKYSVGVPQFELALHWLKREGVKTGWF